jgi:hypothetical protein
MAYIFVDFGAFLRFVVSEVGRLVDTEGYFEECGYIE